MGSKKKKKSQSDVDSNLHRYQFHTLYNAKMFSSLQAMHCDNVEMSV